LNEAAVGLSLWAEYLGARDVTVIAVGDLIWLGALRWTADPVAIGVRRPPDVIGRAVIDG
jgi:hypothetical protein